ncbi:hypothetical protein ACF06W_11735 [Streptomyces albus]|uniref:hypothetical protein n=1 Tax=Streptomyces albus TaxID=1888 RepID=UPI0036F6ABD5
MSTNGVTGVIALSYVLAGVALGTGAFFYILRKEDLAPLRFVAAYLLAFASLAWFRHEVSLVTNLANSLRYVSISLVAAGAWLYQIREVRRRAYQ